MDAAQLDLFPSPIDRALAMRSDGDLAGAIDLLYAALADDISRLAIVSVLASMLAEDEQFDRAERLFQRALAAGPPSPVLLHNYATFLAHSGRPKAGIEVFGDAMATQLAQVRGQLRDGDAGAAAEALDALGGIECMFARSLLVSGDAEGAIAVARRWLTTERTWESATDVVLEAWEALERDEMTEMAALHARQQASPSMVAELGDAAGAASGDDYDAFVVFLQGARYLFEGWDDGFDSPLFLRFQLCLDPGDIFKAFLVAGCDPAIADLDLNTDSGSDAYYAAGEAASEAALVMAGRLRDEAWFP